MQPFPTHVCAHTQILSHSLTVNNAFIAIQDTFKMLKTAWNMKKNNELKNETKNG